MKKFFVKMSLMGCLLVLASCGTARKKSTQKAPEVTLSLMLPQSHNKNFFKEELAEFAKAYPHYRVKVLTIPDTQWIDVVKAKATTGELPDLLRIDKVLMEEIGTTKFVQLDQREPWFKRVRPEQLTNKLIDGKLYGLPVGSSSSVGLIYNVAVFKKLGLNVPKTTSEFLATCQTLKKAGITPLYVSDKESWTSAIDFSSTVSQNMTEADRDALLAGQKKWNNPEYVNLLQFFLTVRQQGYTNADYQEATYRGAMDALAKENCAMYFSGQFFINDVKALNAATTLAMAPAPYKGDILTIKDGTGMFAIAATTKHEKVAKTFLNWFSQPENMDKFNAGWSHSPIFKDQNLTIPAWQESLQHNYLDTGKTSLEMNERFYGLDMSSFWSDQQKMYAGQLTPTEVLSNWDKNFSEQMAKKH